MDRRLLVLGAGGFAREVALVARAIDPDGSHWSTLGFITADPETVGIDLGMGQILGDDGWLLADARPADLTIGMGKPQTRATVQALYDAHGDRFRFPNLVHPSASFNPREVELGSANVVTAGCLLTCDIAIGDGCVLNLGVTVGHDTQIGNHVVINPGANVSGAVTIGDRALIGTGAQILEGLAIGADAIVGSGAVVTHDVDAADTVVGVPARSITARER